MHMDKNGDTTATIETTAATPITIDTTTPTTTITTVQILISPRAPKYLELFLVPKHH